MEGRARTGGGAHFSKAGGVTFEQRRDGGTGRCADVRIDEGENNVFAVMRELDRQKHTRLICPGHPRGIDYDWKRQGFRPQIPGRGWIRLQAAATAA